jgi:hypothetical protein
MELPPSTSVGGGNSYQQTGSQARGDEMSKKRKVTIAELEKILNNPEPLHIHINPDGSITAKRTKQKKKPKVKVLTMKEALGGEYGVAP